MTFRATCDCGQTFHAPTVKEASDLLWDHDLVDHRGQQPTITQLPSVVFHEQAMAAIRSLAATGRPFTIGHCHPLVAVAPANPSTDWPKAAREAEALGWITWTGDYTESVVPTTKGSAVKVWIGTPVAQKGAA